MGIEIHSGKNRIVRRIFESLGYKVVKLDRVFFAGLTKKGLRRGEWRYLTEQDGELPAHGHLSNNIYNQVIITVLWKRLVEQRLLTC